MMATAKQQPTTKFAVTLVVEGDKLETVAKKIKAISDIKVLGEIQKVVTPGAGEWDTEWRTIPSRMNPVLSNTDGRFIQREEEYDDDGNVIPGKYAYYTTWDIHGKQIHVDNKFHFETLEEAKTVVRESLTQAELLTEADILATLICHNSVGAGGKIEDEDAVRAKKAAEAWLLGRNIELPEEKSEEEEGNRSTPEFIVTLHIKASTLPTVEKKAKATFGEKLVGVAKVGRKFSRAADLSQAEDLVNEAVEIVGGLREGMEEWRDGMPENFQQTQKYEDVEQCASDLETLEEELNGINFDVEFPGMF
jgi:hypothetical protein